MGVPVGRPQARYRRDEAPGGWLESSISCGKIEMLKWLPAGARLPVNQTTGYNAAQHGRMAVSRWTRGPGKCAAR